MEIRPVSKDDLAFLTEMALLAAFPPGPLPSGAAEMPHLRRLLDDWGRPEDTGVVAWDGPTRMGAAWSRVMSDVTVRLEDGKPVAELAIAVLPRFRRRGVGTLLLEALLATLTTNGEAAMCLTVNAANPARRLYERAAFQEHVRRGDTIVMVNRRTARGER